MRTFGVIPALARLAPPRLVNGISRLRYRLPWTAPLIGAAARSIASGEAVIRHGIGKGLRFDPHGQNPGYALGTADPLEQQFLADHLRAGDEFYDIGANVGFFAVLGARRVGSEGHVHAFEPFPGSAAAVRKNAALNGMSQITVIEAAVSDRSGRGSFVLMGGGSAEFRLESSALSAVDAAPGAKRIPVDVVAIDELVAAGQLPPPNLVMIDVEGSECEVLRGMAQTIRTHRPVMLCEVHWLVGEFRAVCKDLLEPAGYTVRRLDGKPIGDQPERYHAVLMPA